jgi:hypothetical protein
MSSQHRVSPPGKDSNNNLSAVGGVKSSSFLSGSNSDFDFCSLISEAKPAAILVNDCGEIEIQMNKNHSYFYAYELIFHTDASSSSSTLNEFNQEAGLINSDKLCCFGETKNGSLLLATEKGIIGTINLNKCMTAWISLVKLNCESVSMNANDDLYESGVKKLVDLCVDTHNEQVIILTRYRGEKKPEFKIEVYALNEKLNEMTLQRIHNLTHTLASSSTSQNEPSEFVRIYLDQNENAFVIIDSNNHKVYWFNMSNCQPKRCVKSPDGESIQHPSGLALVPEAKTIYICSKKGMLICRPEQQSVKHESIKPLDISFSGEDRSLYFIDQFALYRSKITDTMANEQRFKRIFSNKTQNKGGFRRVIACQKHIFIMSDDVNSLFVIEREHLKF